MDSTNKNKRYITTIIKDNYTINIFVDESPIDNKIYIEGVNDILREMIKT